MIGVKLHGRLGNQMFQYAYAYSASKKLSASFYMDESIDNFMLNNYFELPGYNPLLNFLKRQWHKTNQPKLLAFEEGKDPLKNMFLIEDDAFYSGFFQSENYFKNHATEIRDEFTINPALKNKFNNKYALIFNNQKVIGVHIRRKDYLNFGDETLGGKNLCLPLSYYKNWLNTIDHSENYRIIFVSDDINYVKENFDHKDNYLFESNDEIIDFQILMNSDILIMANSSFSWWAGYLNKKENKKIYAPEYWLGFKIKKEYPAGIICHDWNKVV